VAPRAGGPFEPGTVERRDLGPTDLAIDIAYVGICHSDLHQVREHWGSSTFSMVPRHEIVGVASAVGIQVTDTRWGTGWVLVATSTRAVCATGAELAGSSTASGSLSTSTTCQAAHYSWSDTSAT
jgi:uncharacterized zinc-type alcohol dehydrogenase-like protein